MSNAAIKTDEPAPAITRDDLAPILRTLREPRTMKRDAIRNPSPAALEMGRDSQTK